MQSVNWAWGLSLIALTIAIHTTGVVMMAVAGLRIRARLETRNLSFWHTILIVVGVVGTAGLLLAVLHGIEATIWAAAYVWLGALNLPQNAILYSVELYDHARRFGADAGTTLADDGRPGGGKRHAVVRYQHGLHFRGDAGVLVDALRCAHGPPLIHPLNCRRPKPRGRRLPSLETSRWGGLALAGIRLTRGDDPPPLLPRGSWGAQLLNARGGMPL